MNTGQKIDRLGYLQAEVARIKVEVDQLKADLTIEIEAGEREEGSIFGASHAQFDRKTVGWKTIAERLEASRQIITANTSTKTIDTIKVTARQV